MCFSELAHCGRIFRPNEKSPMGYKLQVTSLYRYLRHIGRLGMVDKRWIYGGYTSDIRLTCVRCTAENWNLGHHKKGSYDSRDHPSVLNYFKIKVRNSLREERIELNPGLSFFSKLDDIQLKVLLIEISRFCLKKPSRSDGLHGFLVDKERQLNVSLFEKGRHPWIQLN